MATVSLTVRERNRPPVASDMSVTAAAGSATPVDADGQRRGRGCVDLHDREPAGARAAFFGNGSEPDVYAECGLHGQ